MFNLLQYTHQHHSITEIKVECDTLIKHIQQYAAACQSFTALQQNYYQVNMQMVQTYCTTVSCTNDLTLRSGELGGSLLVSEAY